MDLCNVIKKNTFGIDAFSLKIIAAVTMIIDHMGYIFFPQMVFLRIIGRISFPIFAFLIVEGFMHTRNVKKYFLRLLVFAVLSEIPFDFAFFGTFEMKHQNVLITFLLAILVIYIDQQYKRMAGVCATIVLGLVAEFSGCDYGMFGVLLVTIFYWNYDNFINKLVIGTGVLALLVTSIQRYDVVAMIPIALYNGKRGINIKYFFYAFYPGHLTILYFIYLFVH